jgi:asparagine synthase (glutamine-hydrolysing)
MDGYVLNLDALARECGISALPGAPASVVLALLQVDGGMHARFDGAFAIAWTNEARRELTLIRDRWGFKTLMYARTGDGSWCWSSESRPLLPHLAEVRLDEPALSETAHFRWLVGERKLVAGIRQVLPSHAITFSVDEAPRASHYWHYRPTPRHGITTSGWVKEIEAALDETFAALAARYRHAVVPLSGGVDSSLLLAKTREHFSSYSVHALHIHGWTNPELPRAQAVARALDVELQMVEVTQEVVNRNYPRLIQRMEESPRHPSSLALIEIIDAMGACPASTAMIYGQAADTLFGSGDVYRHVTYARYSDAVRLLPRWLRSLAATLVPAAAGGRLRLVRQLLTVDAIDELQALYNVHYRVSPTTVLDGIFPSPRADRAVMASFHDQTTNAHVEAQEHTLFTEIVNLLECTDRFSAGQAYDVVCPFMCDPMLAVARQMPPEAQNHGPVTKVALKELASRYFGRELMFAPKHGFPAPLAGWLRGPLAPYVREFETGSPARAIYRPNAIRDTLNSGDPELVWTMMGLEFALRELLSEPNALVGPLHA